MGVARVENGVSSWLAGTLLLFSAWCVAAVPFALNYQGQILVDGAPFEGAARFKFALVNDAGASLWSHDLSSVNGAEPQSGLQLPVARGLYSVRLGDNMAAIPPAIFTNDVLRLRVWFNDGTNSYQQLTPDRELSSVAFAIRADSARTVDTLPPGIVSRAELAPDVATALADLGEANTNAVQRLLSIEAQLQTLTTQLAALVSATAANSNSVTQVQSAQSTANNRLNALDNSVASVNSKANGIRSDLDDLEEQTVGAPRLFGEQSLKTELDLLQTSVSGLSGSVNGANSAIVSINSTVNGLSQQMSGINSSINQLTMDQGNTHALASSVSNEVMELTEFAVASSTGAGDSNLLQRGFQELASFLPPAWQASGASDIPESRFDHSVMWDTNTGRMLVWGGQFSANWFPDLGAIYDPETDAWEEIPFYAATGGEGPFGRGNAVAAWTGDRMIVWGGSCTAVDPVLNDGGVYNPADRSWKNTSLINAPSGRTHHAGFWSGSRLVVWAGLTQNGYSQDGGFYDPDTDTWFPLTTVNAPSSRIRATAVFTGTEGIFWGGRSVSGPLGDGGRLRLTTAGVPTAWFPLSTNNAPSPRQEHTAIWTGDRMIVWGGLGAGPLNTGAEYDPTTDTWTPLTTENAPAARRNHAAVWTGTEMVIYGGSGNSGPLTSAAAYNPNSGTWRPLLNPGETVARQGVRGVWDAERGQLHFYGGRRNGFSVNVLESVQPSEPTYLYSKP